MTTLQPNNDHSLQESGHDGTEADNATSGSLDISSSVGRGRLASARGRGTRSSSARGTTAARCAGTGSASIGAGGRSDKRDGGAVVCADGDSAGGVDERASASASEGKGVDTGADGGDVSGRRLGSDDGRLRGDDGGLGADVGGSGGHASYDTERVGLGEVAGLGSRVDRRRSGRGRALLCMLVCCFYERRCAKTYLSRGNGEGKSGDEDGSAHLDDCVVGICFGWLLLLFRY